MKYSWIMLLPCLTRSLSTSKSKQALFKFGFIADTQYADIDDDYNFMRTKLRRHRHSLDVLRQAVETFDHHNTDFNILLGDTLDGKSAGLGSQYQCLADIFKYTKRTKGLFHYAFGNHDYYCFNREELFEHMSPHSLQESYHVLGGPCSPQKLYYDFSPCQGWRFIMIDSYDVSMIGSSSEANANFAKKLLAQNNPNDLSKSGGWFHNLPLQNYRFVPYNGGVSEEQLQWLEDVVRQSSERKEKVLCFSHQPVFAPYKPQSVIWNCEDILSILHKYGNTRLWMAGHDHDGQSSIDASGIYHLVPPAPLECEYGQTAFGFIEVHDDELKMNWTGKLPLQPNNPWPERIPV